MLAWSMGEGKVGNGSGRVGLSPEIGFREKVGGGGERGEEAQQANSALLINFFLSSDAQIFVTRHRLSMQAGAKCARTCMQRVDTRTELPFLRATLGGWEERREGRERP